MLIPVEVFTELTAERSRAVSQAAASVQAEGLEVSVATAVIMERWARGEIGTDEMRALVREMYRTP